MVITSLAAKKKGNARLRAGALQQFGAKLIFQEWIGIADIDKEIGKPQAILDKCDRIVPAPGLAPVAEISAQRLDSPRHLRRRDDRRKGAGGAIAAGMAKRNRKRAMSAHRMTED